MLCYAPMLCYAESNDHWSLRVCPIPNLNLIPVVRWRRCPALVMTLDWLLWAAHTISIGAVPALQHLYSRRERGWAESGFAREARRGSAYAPLLLASRPICMRADLQHCTKGLRRGFDIQTPVASRFPPVALLSLWHSPNFMLPLGNVCCPTPFAFRLRPGSISHGYEAQSGFI